MEITSMTKKNPNEADYDIGMVTDSLFVISDLNMGNLTITNDIENVIERCKLNGFNPKTQTLVYFDSYNEPTIATISEKGEFQGYRHPTPDVMAQLEKIAS